MEETVRSYEPGNLLLSNCTNAENFFTFSLQVSSGWAPQRLDPTRNKSKVTFQGHNDAISVQELNLESATLVV